MKKNLTAPIITTMAVGTALGAAYMFTNKKHSTKRKIKKNTDKAVNAVESFVNNVSYMLK